MKKVIKKMTAILLSVAVAVSMIPAMSLFAGGVSYADATGQATDGDSKVIVKTTDKEVLQIKVGETLDVSDCVKISGETGTEKQAQLKWEIVGEANGSASADILGYADDTRRALEARSVGEADVWAYVDGDIDTGLMFRVATYRNLKDIRSDSKAVMKSAASSVETKSSGSSKPVAKLTIAAYPGNKVHLMPHGFITLNTYKDITMNVSYYKYFKPAKKYSTLMRDHADHPEKYTSDPALYNDDDLKISDRESYFSATTNGPYSKPAKVSLKAGESITISNSSFGGSSIDGIIEMLEDSSIASSKDTAELIKQLTYLAERDSSFRLRKALSGGIKTLIKAYREAIETGHNPIDGRNLQGGLMINKELHDQFVGKISRLPNNYYTVEITAAELARLKAFIANPEINYFSFFDNNCTAQAAHIWNTVFSDKPELKVKANFTKFCMDPESLYVELLILRHKEELDGEGGKDFTPRSLAYKIVPKTNPIKVTSKNATVKFKKLKKKAQSIKRSKVITVKNAKGTVTYKKTYGKAKITINKKNGRITVKKGLKKGTYKVKVKVMAAGNSSYKAGAKTTAFKIFVR